ncbi:four helix bundle protein [Neptuniibacter sp. QD48_11]|uniref:four helix bundle protein n=1 Tax=Neptuniibacter sp. QD48_11 TaxID=3398211 RepID=UPI0039F602D0
MSFETLHVWKKACNLSCELYQHFANCRDFGFKDQITRSGLSIPSNIAEGFERGSEKEKRKFLFYARGSAAELRTQILIGCQVGFVEPSLAEKWSAELFYIKKMINTLIQQCGD